MKRSSAITSLCLCGALAAAFALTRGRQATAERGVVSEAATTPPALTGEPPARRERAAPRRDVRAQVVGAVEQATLHVGSTTLDDYLSTLEARARAQGSVTALEVEPGLEMIQRYDPTGERLLQFARRMQALQHELAPEEKAGPNGPPEQRLDALSESIAEAESEAARQVAVQAYLEVARELPPEGEGAALATLNQLTRSDHAAVREAIE